MVKNNSWNKGDRHKIHEIFLINCFVFIINLVWKTIHSSTMTQIKAHLMKKTLQLMFPGNSPRFSWLKKETLWPLHYLGTFFSQITKLKDLAWLKLNLHNIFRHDVNFLYRLNVHRFQQNGKRNSLKQWIYTGGVKNWHLWQKKYHVKNSGVNSGTVWLVMNHLDFPSTNNHFFSHITKLYSPLRRYCLDMFAHFYESISEPKVCMPRLQTETCRATNIFAVH